MPRLDVFISHASEDKLDVARPLAALLLQAGLTVWIDEAELVLGDSLRRKIDEGLAAAENGIVILSKAFFSKEWPKKELDALVAREDGEASVILPIWHGITAKEVSAASPLLADRIAIQTEKGLPAVVAAIVRAVKRRGQGGSAANGSVGRIGVGREVAAVVPKRIDQLVVDFIDRVSEIAEQETNVAGARMGFRDLDLLVGGLSPGELYVVGARASMGSTSFALNVAYHVSCADGLPVLYFSPHAQSQELLNRLIAVAGGIDRWHLSAGRMRDEEWKRLVEAVEAVHRAPMYIDDASTLTLSEIVARSEAIKHEAGALALVVVDTIEMLDRLPRQQTLAEDVRALRQLARSMSCPVLVLTTIASPRDQRIDERPVLSDVGTADVLEQCATAVLLLHREDFYRRESVDASTIEVIVAQNRGRVLGTIKLGFSKESGRMNDFEYPSE